MPPATEPPAVQRFRQLRQALEGLPAEQGAPLLAALDGWLAEGGRLEQHLGLVADEVTQYSKSARYGVPLADRDAALRELAAGLPGSTWQRARTIADWLARAAAGDPLADLPELTAADVAQLPALSARQIYRVLRGDRSA